jgi:hypothetical protein
MIPVSDIWEEIKKINGNCNETVAYRKLNRAVELLANKSDWDPLVGNVDISCDDQTVTLPPEIETPIAVSYGKWPALPRGELFRFHLNGPGDSCGSGCLRWWQAEREAVTYSDLCTPRQIVVSACNADDAGQVVWVYGYDADRNVVRSKQDGVWVDGYPYTAATSPALDASSPTFSEITRVRKPVTAGALNIWTVVAGVADTLLGVYAWDAEEPRFRRLKVDRVTNLVRIHFRRRNFKLRAQTDLIPLHNAEAVVMMVRALKYYDDADFTNGSAAEATAVRWLTEEQFTRNPTIAEPVQVSGTIIIPDDDIH